MGHGEELEFFVSVLTAIGRFLQQRVKSNLY